MISVLSLPNGQQLIARVLEEDEVTITVEYPLIMILSNPIALTTSIYTTRYMPMASEGIVTFNKQNVVGVASIDTPLESYYNKMVDFFKSKVSVYRTADDGETSQKELSALMSRNEDDISGDPDDVISALFESRDKTKH